MGLELAKESFSAILAEVSDLAKRHWDEIGGVELEPQRPFDLDLGQMIYLDKIGNMRVYTARISSKLVGYCSWTLAYDCESKGLLIANQGAWYCEPKSGAGLRLFKFSINDLRKLGVRCIYPHHHLMGRGADLHNWFNRLGAKPMQVVYSLWIGPGPSAQKET
jgi:hypothetical protein